MSKFEHDYDDMKQGAVEVVYPEPGEYWKYLMHRFKHWRDWKWFHFKEWIKRKLDGIRARFIR